ncbi:glycosyltransferase family 4 protein [candidate division KSB1 bacterium]
MRILLLYHSPWWNAAAYYGVTLAEGLQAAGHTVWFGTDKASPSAQKAAAAGIGLFHILLQTASPFGFLRQIRRLAAFVNEHDIDLIDTFSPPGHLMYALGKRFYKIAVPLVRSCCDARKPNTNPLNKYLYRKCVDRLIFPCEAIRESYYERVRFDRQRASVIYPAIDLDRFDSNRQEISHDVSFEKNSPVVGIVARLSPEKGHEHFLKVAARIVAVKRNVTFVVIGKEEQITVDALREHADHLGIKENVVFTGFVNDPRKLMGDITIGVIASRFSEAVSRAALEYFAAGKPVVATKVNVLSEIIEPGINGFTYDIDDVTGMADGIQALLDDRKLYDTMARNARDSVEKRYNLQKFTEETIAVYDNVLTGGGRG